MAIVVAQDPTLANDVATILNGPGDDPVADWAESEFDSPLYKHVDEIATTIETSSDGNET